MSDVAFKQIYRDNSEIIRSLHSLPLFGDLSADILERLAPLSEFVTFKKGAEILKEGQINNELYLLVSGIVVVNVEGEFITKLSRHGDLIGEMSVISESPCSATIIADSEAELLRIDVHELHEKSLGNTEIQATLYRIFSLILAKKLSLTNQKAKQFEEIARLLEIAKEDLQRANDNLEQKVEQRTYDLKLKTLELGKSNVELENRNAAIMASHRKLEDLYDTKDTTLKKLADLNKNQLNNLGSMIKKLGAGGNSKPQLLIQKAAKEVAHIQQVLQPLTNLYHSEKAIKSKRVLLAENNRRKQIIAQMALGGTGVTLDVVSDTDSGLEYLDRYGYDIICVNTELLELSSRAREKNEKIKTVFMTSEDPSQYIEKLRQHSFLSNIVSIHDDDKIFTVKNMMTTVSKLITQDFFGLEKYLSWGVEVKEHVIANSRDRAQLVKEMQNYLKQLGLYGRMINKCSLVAEELLMNAIYDAPTDFSGKAAYNHLSRSVAVELNPEERGVFRYACDGTLVAISAEDPFGAITRETILNYLEMCFNDQVTEVHEGKGGGGFGVFQIMKTSDLVVFNVTDKIRTEVIAIFNVKDITDEKVKTNSFHYFLKSKDE